MSRDKTIGVLWKENEFVAIPTEVLFIRFSGRIRYYRNVSFDSIKRLDDIRQGNDKRIRWEQPGEVARYLANADINTGRQE